jgi:hypothetical protein
MQPANCLTSWIRAGATGQEGIRAVEERSLLKTIRKGSSGSQLPASGIRHERLTDEHETRTPPGISTPDIVAPDGGTTRVRPAGVGTAMRSASLITAVCFFRR